MTKWLLGIGAAFFAVLVVAALIGLFVWLNTQEVRDEVQLGLLISVAVALVLLLLVASAIGFRLAKMADPKEALGLPPGSVRALIAIFLILMFSIMGVFVFRVIATNEGAQGEFERLTIEQIEVLTADGRSIREIAPDDPADPQTFSGSFGEPLSEDARQVGIQLITILGTLVTAVAAFYFGAQAVAAATQASNLAAASSQQVGEPLLRTVTDPASASLQRGTATAVTVSGKNLANVTAARARSPSGSIVIEGTAITSSDDSVHATFQIPAGSEIGLWSVEVETTGGKDTLAEAFVVT